MQTEEVFLRCTREILYRNREKDLQNDRHGLYRSIFGIWLDGHDTKVALELVGIVPAKQDSTRVCIDVVEILDQ